jgi:hypothetical protein
MPGIQGEWQEAVTTTVPAEDKLLEVQGDTSYVHLGRPLGDARNLIPSAN